MTWVRSAIRPTVLRTSMPPPLMVANPAESYRGIQDAKPSSKIGTASACRCSQQCRT